jgi:hypothetical protein
MSESGIASCSATAEAMPEFPVNLFRVCRSVVEGEGDLLEKAVNRSDRANKKKPM